jgi:transcriptional regulator with GAF, ATPase, and Fis domain
MPSPAHLVILPPTGPAFAAAIGDGEAEVGSGAGVAIRIADPEVATVHAVIRAEERGYVLERRAPLLVNGKKTKQHVLGPYDLVTLGRTALSFRFGAPAAMGKGLDVSALELCRRLNEFSSRLVAGATAAELTKWFVSDVLALTGGERGALVRLAGIDAETLGFVDATSGAFTDADAELSTTVIARLRDEGAPLLITDAPSDADLKLAPSIMQSNTTAVMCAPIRHGGHIVGALYVSTRRGDTFNEETLELVTVYAAHASHLLGAAQRDRDLTARLGRAGQAEGSASSLVGTSESMERVRRQIEKVARHDISVLVMGATGTGKDVVARELHRLGPRAKGPFIAVNCGAIPEQLLQSELFGHTEGAFTHAVKSRQGWIRSADGGTLFLDEVGEMPVAQQAMLLRVLQNKVVTPVGSETAHPVDFRLVCATNKDLQERVSTGGFREDLYYRIADVVIAMPALAERGDDVVELANHFLRLQRDALGRDRLRFSAASLSAIRRAGWPGNVREIEAAVRRAALLSEGDAIEPSDLGLTAAQAAADQSAAEADILPLSAARDAYLKRYVTQIVERMGGNRTEAAKALGVSARTVFKYLEEI